MKLAASIIAIWAFAYAIFAFVTMNIFPSGWTMDGRFSYVLISSAASCAVIINYIMGEPK